MRATVVRVYGHVCLVRAAGAPIQVPFTEIFEPQDTDAAVAAIALVAERLDRLRDLVLRAQAEIYELGGHAMPRPSP